MNAFTKSSYMDQMDQCRSQFVMVFFVNREIKVLGTIHFEKLYQHVPLCFPTAVCCHPTYGQNHSRSGTISRRTISRWRPYYLWWTSSSTQKIYSASSDQDRCLFFESYERLQIYCFLQSCTRKKHRGRGACSLGAELYDWRLPGTVAHFVARN